MERKNFNQLSEIRSILPPLTADEFKQLEISCLKDGIREPLVIWKEKNILIDGAHRIRIIDNHNLPFETVEYEFKDFEAVKIWILENQLGKRNAPPILKEYINSQLPNRQALTAFAESMQTLTSVVGQDITNKILNSEIQNVTPSQIVSIASKEEQEIEEILEGITEGYTNNLIYSKTLAQGRKSKEYKPHEVNHAIEYSKSLSTLESYQKTHNHIIKVQASKYTAEIDWMGIVINEWVNRNDPTPFEENIQGKYQEFKDNHSMTPLDAFSMYVTNLLGKPDKQIFSILCDLFAFFEVIENCKKIRMDIHYAIVMLDKKYNDLEENQRDYLNHRSINKIINYEFS